MILYSQSLLTLASRTNTNGLLISVNLTDAANVASEIGTPTVIKAKIHNVYSFVTANEMVCTAKIDAKRCSK